MPRSGTASTRLAIFSEDQEFASTAERRYAARAFEVRVVSEARELAGRSWDVVVLKHSPAATVFLRTWTTIGLFRSRAEVVMIVAADAFESETEHLPQAVTDVLRIPLNWPELDWRLQKARDRRCYRMFLRSRLPEQESGAPRPDAKSDIPTPPAPTLRAPPLNTSGATLEELQREHVRRILMKEKGNKARAARALGIHRRSLYRLIARFGIAPSIAESHHPTTTAEGVSLSE